VRRALLAVAACEAIVVGAIAVRDWRRGYRSTDGATLVSASLRFFADRCAVKQG